MILNLKKVKTRIAILHNIPKSFFRNIEAALVFDDHLFPSWSEDVFSKTDLKKKFKVVYDAYKSIADKADRDLIIEAFENCNQIEKLCANDLTLRMITIHDLPQIIREPVSSLFEYLYKTATKYPGFQDYTKNTVSNLVDEFIANHHIEVCPFCGLEGFTNLNGQARLALDHWLSRGIFPFAAVNFNNLIPIGDKCNSRPAKGDKNILVNNTQQQRTVAYYPYAPNGGVSVSFDVVKEPSIDGIDWSLAISPKNADEQHILDSWDSTLNISTRYEDFMRKNVLNMWEHDYRAFIEEDHDIEHAQSLDAFKSNLKIWKASFPVNKRPGFLAYRSFIDYLLTKAGDAYLTGLYKNFYSEYVKSLPQSGDQG